MGKRCCEDAPSALHRIRLHPDKAVRACAGVEDLEALGLPLGGLQDGGLDPRGGLQDEDAGERARLVGGGEAAGDAVAAGPDQGLRGKDMLCEQGKAAVPFGFLQVVDLDDVVLVDRDAVPALAAIVIGEHCACRHDRGSSRSQGAVEEVAAREDDPPALDIQGDVLEALFLFPEERGPLLGSQLLQLADSAASRIGARLRALAPSPFCGAAPPCLGSPPLSRLCGARLLLHARAACARIDPAAARLSFGRHILVAFLWCPDEWAVSFFREYCVIREGLFGAGAGQLLE